MRSPIVNNDLATITGYGESETAANFPIEGKVRLHYCGDESAVLCSLDITATGKGDSGGPVVTLALHCETDTNAQDQQYEDYADETEEDEEYAPNIANSRTSVIKLRSIPSKIKRSEIVKKKFQSACEAAVVPSNLNPILNCPTRWNSTHDMIGFGLKVRAGINILCSSVTELNDFQITASEWQILEKIHKPKAKAQTFDLTIWVKQLKTESLRKFNELYEEYYSLHSLNKSLELPRKENKVCNEDEDVIDFDKLCECPSTSSGSCLQGLVIDELEEYLRKPRAASSEDILDW
ncbi:unnamed protein product [Diatraea saccharalis]|uniref:Uncharacterized protein n=1 Tax=Diatraea saccharalis TaxID=40085 RepID=A0A9N9RBA7_9NEOP|nr:unnamed protein product [Diatraea saccharalis]